MKERKTDRETSDKATPDLADLIHQITPDNIHPTLYEDEVGQEVTEYDEDEELKRLAEDRLDQLEVEVDIDSLD